MAGGADQADEVDEEEDEVGVEVEMDVEGKMRRGVGLSGMRGVSG